MIVSYMGTKRHLAHHVQRLARDCSSGPLLDGFSGTCAIGRSLAVDRQIWSNDLQAFAHQVALAQFCSIRANLEVSPLIRKIKPLFEENMNLCAAEYASNFGLESLALKDLNVELATQDFDQSMSRAQNIYSDSTCLPTYSLMTSRYGGTYFGHFQASEGDSIRYAIDSLKNSSIIDCDTHRWSVLAVCLAMSRISTTTGHFAQPLKPKAKNARRHFSQRSRSVWKEWLDLLPTLQASGTRSWRRRNKAYQGDTLDLLKDLEGESELPALVYADPPYTKDQYSRFYHIFETIVLYDFPECQGAGLYRADRAISAFSQASKVEEAVDQLIEGVRKVSASLILSYPTEGLLSNSTIVIPRMILDHFKAYPDVLEIEFEHSTMGGSKGKNKQKVRERLYRVLV